MTKIHAKILDFQNNVESIKKDATNPHFKNSYASLPNILLAVKPILNALKCTLTQPVINNEVHTIITCCESGELISSSIALPNGLSAQQIGSAITYYRRYTLTSLLALDIEEDDDGNTASQPPPANEQKEWLNKFTDKSQTKHTDNYLKVVDALTSKKYSLADIEKKYKLNKELKAELEQL